MENLSRADLIAMNQKLQIDIINLNTHLSQSYQSTADLLKLISWDINQNFLISYTKDNSMTSDETREILSLIGYNLHSLYYKEAHGLGVIKEDDFKKYNLEILLDMKAYHIIMFATSLLSTNNKEESLKYIDDVINDRFDWFANI